MTAAYSAAHLNSPFVDAAYGIDLYPVNTVAKIAESLDPDVTRRVLARIMAVVGTSAELDADVAAEIEQLLIPLVPDECQPVHYHDPESREFWNDVYTNDLEG